MRSTTQMLASLAAVYAANAGRFAPVAPSTPLPAPRSSWKHARKDAIARRSARPGRAGWKGEARARKEARRHG